MKLFAAFVAGLLAFSGCSHASASAKGEVGSFLDVPIDDDDKLALGAIDEDMATVTAAWFARKAKIGAKAATIEIDSPGGSVFAGFVIARAIENSGMRVTCVVDGMAASMAFVILQSCNVRVMTERSVLMVHGVSASGMMSGDEVAWRNQAEFMRVLNAAMVAHCARRMGMPPAELAKRIDGGREWWLDYDAAQYWHAVDYSIAR